MADDYDIIIIIIIIVVILTGRIYFSYVVHITH
jgi:hypothetical protein